MSLVSSMVERLPRLAHRVLPQLVACRLYGSMDRAAYLRDTYLALQQAGLYSRRNFLGAHAVRHRFIADKTFIAHARPGDIARHAVAVPAGDANFAAIRQRLAQGHPLLLGCSYFGSVYFALLALRGLVRELLIVVARDPSSGSHYFDKVAQASGIRITVAGTAERGIGLRIMRHLGRGGVVATMLDCFYGERVQLRGEFLGRPAASLGTLYALGRRAGALVVPTASIRKEGKQVLDVGAPIDLSSNSIEDASQRVNDYYSALVRACPGQWMGWPNLLARWRMAAQTY